MLFQGPFCKCLSLDPEVSDEGEVWGDGEFKPERDVERGREECKDGRKVQRFKSFHFLFNFHFQRFKSENCGRCALPSSLHPSRRLGLPNGRLFQLGRRGSWAGHPSNNSLAPGVNVVLNLIRSWLNLSFKRLTSVCCWLNFPTLTRRHCWIWWMVLGMTTPSTFKGTWSLWKGDPEYLSRSEITWEIQLPNTSNIIVLLFRCFHMLAKLLFLLLLQRMLLTSLEKVFLKLLRFPTVAEVAQLSLTHSQANMIELDNYLNPINLYRTFPICLGKENSIWDGCSTAEILVWCQNGFWVFGSESIPFGGRRPQFILKPSFFIGIFVCLTWQLLQTAVIEIIHCWLTAEWKREAESENESVFVATIQFSLCGFVGFVFSAW